MHAKLTIDPTNQISKIDDRLYSALIEHLGRGVYDGLYNPGNAHSDDNGFRQDVVKAVKDLNIDLIRYPGGNFVSGYNWEDGIGPKDQRPTRLDLAWRSIETNQFGLHEFMKWTQQTGTRPDMAVNLGSRGIDAARNLIEYCNFPGGTYWSDLRKKNGAEKPFNIKTWCLGNEMDGDWQIGHKTAEEYGRLAHETAKVMRLVDPNIDLVVSGSSTREMATFGSWEETVLDHTYDDVDYLSLHRYYDNQENDLENFLAKSIDFDEFISGIVAVCDAVKARKHSTKTLNLALDEWNVWYHSHKQDDETAPWQHAPHLLEDHYNFEDALMVGTMLITLLKHADRVKIACLAQLVNVIAPIMTDDQGIWLQSIFFPFMQVSKYGRGIALAPKQTTPTYNSKDFQDVPVLDSLAVYNPDQHEVVVFAENKGQTPLDFSTELCEFTAKNLVEATQFCGYGIKETNEDQHMHLQPNTQVTVDAHQLSTTLAPLSWNMFRIQVAD
ncbi:alpha-l-arabinofuranosidase 1 [Levilactobacillus namurensis DSM 19117]|uniref:non-reducing end alpha-L-arabinofuranosidase n=1 Tax=Levilactobacillus namurensis DSM 19117 TaxID=1423773 RepID=A0A0R1JQQ7_9LACO|nr:alpha-N-arabinofuranosidase [Levilactobacillus namurensis]KRK73480.1 alpha-l-arabinofuranosidase 1 [Levilactobacillus namurensis DSM 19117]GEO74034.1 alpha-N-arabinofuranosidase [Levilactobacillus namurensis]